VKATQKQHLGQADNSQRTQPTFTEGSFPFLWKKIRFFLFFLVTMATIAFFVIPFEIYSKPMPLYFAHYNLKRLCIYSLLVGKL